MRRFAALGCFVLLGCAGSAPLPPKKEVIATPVEKAKPAASSPLTQGQAHAEIIKTQKLPKAERFSAWRTWAADLSQPQLQAHALTQLFGIADPERFSLALKALESSHARVRTTAARILAESPSNAAVKSNLLKALPAAADEERGAILWALVVHGEKSIASKAVDELRNGLLPKITELDGRPGFDALTLAALFSADEIKNLAKDKSPTVRQMVALQQAYETSPEATAMLLELLQDADEEVSGTAAGGLARSPEKRSRQAVLQVLRAATKEQYQRRLEKIRDIAGGPGLILALDAVPAKPEETVWFRTKQIFDMLEGLADPRIADPLWAWARASKRHAHWLGEAGIRLAEVGDVRGAKLIGERMRVEPTKLYVQAHFWEADAGGHLARTDSPRVVGARMLADLAVIHPDKHAELLDAAESGVLGWINSRPQPHANALRFLAGAGSKKALSDLRKWAFPTDPLPKPGASPPFPVVFETAQMSLRYIGLRKDEPSFPKLIEQLQRKKDKSLNITQDGLMEAGLAMLGMSLRAIGYGASQGLAHFGDSRAVTPLVTFIEDETWHEEARQAACEALAWCADAKAMGEIAQKAQSFGQSKEPAKATIAACYAQTLALRPVPEIVPQLVEALGPGASAEVRMAYGRAIGMAGFDAASEEKLFRKLEDPASRQAAALALVLGGNADIVTRTIATLADLGPAVLDEFKDTYYRAFGFWSDQDFARGAIYRWVANAEIIRRVEVAEKSQNWAMKRLESQFENLRFDNGPHSETRVVLRYRLWQDAKTGSAERRRGAIKTLELMRERGVLLALREETGDLGYLARRALHRIANPLPMQPE